MTTASTKYIWLAPNDKSSYRQLFVKGTRIPARVLYGWHVCEEPRTSQEIAADYNLPIEAVKEAIAYCQSNPPAIAEDQARDEALMQATGISQPEYRYHAMPKTLSPEERAKLLRP